MSIINGAGLNAFRSQFTAGSTYALAEIIDNSIQWKHPEKDSEINIILIESHPSWWMRDVIITDNGIGMDKETLSSCLDFGGGRNHNYAKDGQLGKFGLGLPYSSCSQSPNYHVYSWQKKGDYIHTYRNHNDYAQNDPVESNGVDQLSALPTKITDAFPDLVLQNSGTVIHWKECDKLDVKQAKTFIKHIEENLGRIYRHFLNKNVHINFLVYRDLGDKLQKDHSLSRPIRVFDPLFLMENTCLPGVAGKKPTSEVWGGKNGSGEETLNFLEKKENNEIIEHNIKLRYSIAKIEIQKPGGTSDGGSSEIGGYYKKAKGISLVRANRELKLDNFGFQFPNSDESINRWWSVEVSFEPISDDILGVNANKLDAKNFRYLSSNDKLEIEKDGILDPYTDLRSQLSRIIERSIRSMYDEIKARGKGLRTTYKCPACNENTYSSGVCSNCSYTSNYCSIHIDELLNEAKECKICAKFRPIDMCLVHKLPMGIDGCPKCVTKRPALKESERQELIDLLGDYSEFEGNDDAIERTINWFQQSNNNHFIVFTDLKNPATFINYHSFQVDKFVIIEVNISHPYYDHFFAKILEKNDNEAITPLLLFIASWVETEMNDYSNTDTLTRFRSKFGINLMDLIANWANK
jgi:hypothetical protein